MTLISKLTSRGDRRTLLWLVVGDLVVVAVIALTDVFAPLPQWYVVGIGVACCIGLWIGLARDLAREAALETRRIELGRAYCAERGWDPENLTPEQWRTITAQPEWGRVADL